MNTLKKYEWKSYIVFTGYVLGGLITLWIFLSWINVILHNSTDHVYWVFNFFRIFWR